MYDFKMSTTIFIFIFITIHKIISLVYLRVFSINQNFIRCNTIAAFYSIIKQKKTYLLYLSFKKRLCLNLLSPNLIFK